MFSNAQSNVQAPGLAAARQTEPRLFGDGVVEFAEAMAQLDPVRCGFGRNEVSAVEASWRCDDVDFYWYGGFVVRLRDGRRAYIEGSRAPVYDERDPNRRPTPCTGKFDAWLIPDQPVHSLTPLQALQPVSWDEAPERLNEFLKRSASAA
jgi:hypothetical protein